MTITKKYSPARAFRVALAARLKQIADNEKIDLQRRRRLVAFDRLLARIIQSKAKRWGLKGGYAMELRMKAARTTKDIDLVIEDPKQIEHHNESLRDTLLEKLRDQALDLVDITLLLQRGELKSKRIKESLAVVFARRKTHQLPEIRNPPPDDWTPVFNKMAEACNITTSIDEALSTKTSLRRHWETFTRLS